MIYGPARYKSNTTRAMFIVARYSENDGTLEYWSGTEYTKNRRDAIRYYAHAGALEIAECYGGFVEAW